MPTNSEFQFIKVNGGLGSDSFAITAVDVSLLQRI